VVVRDFLAWHEGVGHALLDLCKGVGHAILAWREGVGHARLAWREDAGHALLVLRVVLPLGLIGIKARATHAALKNVVFHDENIGRVIILQSRHCVEQLAGVGTVAGVVGIILTVSARV
jgi:hypothetical protein